VAGEDEGFIEERLNWFTGAGEGVESESQAQSFQERLLSRSKPGRQIPYLPPRSPAKS